VSSEVTVEQCDGADLVAISSEPRAPGEMLVIEFADGATPVHASVRVAHSQPIIVAGSVRHRLSLIRVAHAH
jgi:hypothetical protein